MFRKVSFLVVGIGELFFFVWALMRPFGYDQYGYLFLGNFDVYLIAAAIISSFNTYCFWTKSWLKLSAILNVMLAVMWLAIFLSPIIIGWYPISLPLYLLMFWLRALMATIVESEARLMEQ